MRIGGPDSLYDLLKIFGVERIIGTLRPRMPIWLYQNISVFLSLWCVKFRVLNQKSDQNKKSKYAFPHQLLGSKAKQVAVFEVPMFALWTQLTIFFKADRSSQIQNSISNSQLIPVTVRRLTCWSCRENGYYLKINRGIWPVENLESNAILAYLRHTL